MRVVFPYAAYENLGIEYLSAVLKKAGHETRLVFDPQLFGDKFVSIPGLRGLYDQEAHVIREILTAAPDVVAFSVLSSDLMWALRIARGIKANRDISIVFGGIHPSSVPRRVLAEDCVDFVIVLEGEYPLRELVDQLSGERRFDRVRNLLYKNGGTIHENPVRPPMEDLDALPFPDKDLFYERLEFLKSEYTIMTRRGCLNACTYCHNSIWRERYRGMGCSTVRVRSVDNVMAELRAAYEKYKFTRLRVNDDLLTSHKEWLHEFSLRYSAEFNAPVWCYVSPSTIDEEVVRSLKRLGCYQVSMGVQSIDPVIRRKVLHRGETNREIEDAIRLFRQYGIRCITDNIIGLPLQSEDELLDLASFYLENPVDRICVYWLIYFPGTKIVNIGLAHGEIDGETIRRIETEPVASANTVRNRLNDENLIRYNLLLLLIQVLPRNWSRTLIRRRLYERFPAVNPAPLEAVMTLFMKDRKEIERVRFLRRYLHFIGRIPLARLRDLMSRIVRRASRKKQNAP